METKECKCFRCKGPVFQSSRFCRDCYETKLEYPKKILNKVISDRLYWEWRNSSDKTMNATSAMLICQEIEWAFYLKAALTENEHQNKIDTWPLLDKLTEQINAIEKLVKRHNKRPAPKYVKQVTIPVNKQQKTDMLEKLLALEKHYQQKENEINKVGWGWIPS